MIRVWKEGTTSASKLPLRGRTGRAYGLSAPLTQSALPLCIVCTHVVLDIKQHPQEQGCGVGVGVDSFGGVGVDVVA